MSRMLALVTACAIVVSPIPVSAQATPGDPGAGRLFSAEAIRRAVAGADSAQAAPDQPRSADWKRVVALKPGEVVVVVTATGPTTGDRMFILADDTRVAVLNVTDAALPRVAVDQLRDMAKHDSQRLVSLVDTGSWTDQDRKTRIGADGVFVDGRRVAALGDVVVRTERRDVVEVRRGGGASASLQRFCGPFALGWLGGVLAGAAIAKASNADESDLRGLFWGGMIGGFTVGIWSSLRSPSLIYRRP